MKEKPIPYMSNDKFSQEGIFQYWTGRLSGHTHGSQEKNHGQDPGKHIEGINQYEIADL